ncbi:hypothetical protein [Pararhizobium sp. DWP3-4]|uniref:hypothetical protein n=1 Tax=Pararhizobium sp. DWP3-4 TaxID=2804565 RepID=UPI003CEDB4F7
MRVIFALIMTLTFSNAYAQEYSFEEANRLIKLANEAVPMVNKYVLLNNDCVKDYEDTIANNCKKNADQKFECPTKALKKLEILKPQCARLREAEDQARAHWTERKAIAKNYELKFQAHLEQRLRNLQALRGKPAAPQDTQSHPTAVTDPTTSQPHQNSVKPKVGHSQTASGQCNVVNAQGQDCVKCGIRFAGSNTHTDHAVLGTWSYKNVECENICEHSVKVEVCSTKTGCGTSSVAKGKSTRAQMDRENVKRHGDFTSVRAVCG